MGIAGLLRRLFEPLGYGVTAAQHPLDETVPPRGDSRYFTVDLAGTVRVRDLLAHLTVLIPVLDDEKHYWVGDDEVEKLMRRGAGWLAALRDNGARRVLDLGCGEGRLLEVLLREPACDRVAGMDVSHRALAIARERLRLDRLPEQQRERIALFQGALTYRDKRLAGYDAAAVVEVIEHLDPPRLATFERVLFEFAGPGPCS